MSDFEIHGADEFSRLSKALKAAGRTGMRRELNAAMRRAAKPLTKVAKDAAHEVFPHAGGLDDREAQVRFTARTYTSADDHGVKIVAPRNAVAARTTNATGSFRKPVFADKSKPRKEWTWADQEIPGSTGWFDRAMGATAPFVVPELEKAIVDVEQQILRGGS